MAGFKYQSPETRALASITPDSYDKDQAKNLIKLNNDVGYMAQYMRKMQGGIDSANSNVIEQIQNFVNDIVVLIGGGNAKGFDLGDLRYIFQMWGALFGFNTEGGIAAALPMNLIDAVWHMVSNFLFPTGAFKGIINQIIDGAIGTMLSWFGDIPIIGGAVEQFAEWISEFRDNFWILDARFGTFIHNITDGLGEGIDFLAHILTKVFNAFIQPIIDLISGAIGGPANQLIGFIQHVIGTIFNLANGADTKASKALKKASPLWDSVDGNGETSVNISAADTLLVINATNSRGAFIRTLKGELKQTISLIASKAGTVSTFYLDVYALNSANGLDWIYTTPDLSGALIPGAGNETVIFHEMDDEDAFASTPNNYYLVIGRITGSGSVNIQGRVFPVANTVVRPLYPGVLRNPVTLGAAPTNILSSVVDDSYVKETPYFQIGTLEDITPQSFFFDFSALTSNLWYWKRLATSISGLPAKLAVKDGYLYLPGNVAGFSAITHKYNVATNKCRVGIRYADAPNTRDTFAYMFSKLDMSSYVGFSVREVGSSFKIRLVVGDGLNSFTYISADMTPPYNPGNFYNQWMWLEYDPDDGKYRILINPDFNDISYRDNATIDFSGPVPVFAGSVMATIDETIDPALENLPKDSTSRSGGAIIGRGTGGTSVVVEDLKLEDYMLPS